MDSKSPKAGGDEVRDALTDEMGSGVVWALLWLIMNAERHAVALALVGDKSNDAGGAETLRRWAEPQLAAFRRDEDVPTIPWWRVAKLLRQLPCNQG